MAAKTDTPWNTLTRHAQVHERIAQVMKLSEVYESTSQSLKVEDLQKKRVTLTVKGIEPKKFDEGDKFVMSFEETPKTFVLNKTNARMMEQLTESDDSDDWLGYRITLRPDMTTFNGKATPCIRIDSELPVQRTKAKAAPVGNDEIPF